MLSVMFIQVPTVKKRFGSSLVLNPFLLNLLKLFVLIEFLSALERKPFRHENPRTF